MKQTPLVRRAVGAFALFVAHRPRWPPEPRWRSPSSSTASKSAAAKSDSTEVGRKEENIPLRALKGSTKSARRPAKPKQPSGALGSGSGERHLAFRGAGSDLDSLWPPKMPETMPGSILPNRRIIAFYGNPLSKRMGILGEFETDEMLRKLDQEVAEWNKLDPAHPVQPALHLIAVVAQADPGRDGNVRLAWTAR